MRLVFRLLLVCGVCAACSVLFGCAPADNTNANTTVTTNVPPPAASPTPQNLSVVERPQKIKDQMTARGAQDEAAPTLRFITPTAGATINGSTVNVKLALSGDLKGYKPGKDPTTMVNNDPSTMKGNHIHVILDNQPYEAYYNLDQPFELRNVTAGKHTLRAFPSRPWHESYKNAGAFQMITFTVKGGGDASQPTTTGTGEKMADNKNASATNKNANAAGTPNANAANTNTQPHEGKDMPASEGGAVDPKKPLLTYSRPKGEYKGADADAIMIDFWLSNAKLKGEGGEYTVRYSVDGGAAQTLDKWQPIWLAGWASGKHTIKLELLDKDGHPVDNGGYNTTTREITVTK